MPIASEAAIGIRSVIIARRVIRAKELLPHQLRLSGPLLSGEVPSGRVDPLGAPYVTSQPRWSERRSAFTPTTPGSLTQGLRQLMAGARKFTLECISRDDIVAGVLYHIIPSSVAVIIPTPRRNMIAPEIRWSFPSRFVRHLSARAVVVYPKWTAPAMMTSGRMKIRL